ncbi:AAA-12 domain-containing protein [Fusarium sp. LHS14.1]|nr:AAA-12 domain-containing protein [Fusarium sp. LHS14.1]
MDLHRALRRGNGFYDWMVKPDPRSTNAPPMLRALPSINFFDIEDKAYADAIVAEALPQDRSRFRGYLSNRPLGLGMITAGHGFGKTTAGAAATLAMHAKLGKILCSAPTNVAVDNFASRLDIRTRAVVERYNRGLQGGQPRRRHTFVVRAYRPEHESVAFERLLQDSRIGDGAAPKPFARRPSKWRLHLSCAFWLLVLLRSPVVRELHPDDSPVLHEIQQALHDHDSTLLLREVATGAITLKQFKEADNYAGAITVAKDLLAYIPDQADLLCTTPSCIETVKQYRLWKNSVARGVSIDEAANMHRGDLYCVWGNTLLPCFLFGDPKQLSPTVMTNSEQHRAVSHRDDEGDVDMEGNQEPVGFLNRFAMDGKISALQYLQGNGIPVYRLKTQLRMAKGVFDMAANVIYPDVPLDYDPSREVIGNAEFQIGRDLEAFAQVRFPELAACPVGTLKPFFIHCEKSRVYVDQMTGSRISVDQVRIALDFAAEFVKSKKTDPRRIVVITPYFANAQLINIRLRRPEYACLSSMQEAMTIDSFQGQENDITIAIMTTAHPYPGPGFTIEAQHLNVMLTRHKCGLVIVGKGSVAQKQIRVEGPGGEIFFTRATALRELYKELHASGRVATVEAQDKEAGEIKEEKQD